MGSVALPAVSALTRRARVPTRAQQLAWAVGPDDGLERGRELAEGQGVGLGAVGASCGIAQQWVDEQWGTVVATTLAAPRRSSGMAIVRRLLARECAARRRCSVLFVPMRSVSGAQ